MFRQATEKVAIHQRRLYGSLLIARLFGSRFESNRGELIALIAKLAFFEVCDCIFYDFHLLVPYLALYLQCLLCARYELELCGVCVESFKSCKVMYIQTLYYRVNVKSCRVT